jgi:hypothetical protein
MPKSRSKTQPKSRPKNQLSKSKLKTKPEPVNITKSKFYWISLTISTVIVVLGYGIVAGIAMAQVGLILVTALSVIGVVGYVRLKPSILTTRTRATYLFVGAAVIGYGIWATLVIVLAVTGFGLQVQAALGGQLFIITSQIIFLVVGASIGEYLSTNNAFQSFAGKVKQKIGF